MVEIKRHVYYISNGETKSSEVEIDAKRINLSSKDISYIDTAHITAFQYLTHLFLSQNEITSIPLASLTKCTRLEHLDLSYNQIVNVDLSPLLECENLVSLKLNNNELDNINLEDISGHPSLESIELNNNKFTDFSFKPLENIPRLTSLSLQNNYLSSANLAPLSRCQYLMELKLGGNSLRKIDLSPLRNVSSLRSLLVQNNRLESVDLEPLSEVESLQSLFLNHNQLRNIDVSPLGYCTLLKILLLENNLLQVVDVTSLYNCSSMAVFSVDEVVILRAVKDVKSYRLIPNGIKKLLHRVILYPSTDSSKPLTHPKPSKPKSSKKSEFIDTRDLVGLFYELATEINDSFNTKCYVCAAFLSRKLIENLVISILMRRFQKTNPEYYLIQDRKGDYNRTRGFHYVLDKFWEVFQEEFAPVSATTNKKRLESLKMNMYRLKDEFNVDAHQLGSFRNEKSLISIKNDLEAIIKFLNHIDNRVK